MAQTIDMTCMRYLNLFGKITGVSTKNCFSYNHALVFAVPGSMLSRAIGEHGSNLKRISAILGKRIKVVATPRNENDAGKFFSIIVAPLTLRGIEIFPSEIVISSNVHNKASLIGRDKARLIELDKISKEFFGKTLRIA